MHNHIPTTLKNEHPEIYRKACLSGLSEMTQSETAIYIKHRKAQKRATLARLIVLNCLFAIGAYTLALWLVTVAIKSTPPLYINNYNN